MVLIMCFFGNKICGNDYGKSHSAQRMEEKEEGCFFSYPLHLSMVDEIMVNDLVGNGLDDKCYGIVWEKGPVFDFVKGKV